MKKLWSSKSSLAVTLLSFACFALLVLNFLNTSKLAQVQESYDRLSAVNASSGDNPAAVLATENQELKDQLEAQENSDSDTIQSDVTDFLKANYENDELTVDLEVRSDQIAPYVTDACLEELCPVETSPPPNINSCLLYTSQLREMISDQFSAGNLSEKEKDMLVKLIEAGEANDDQWVSWNYWFYRPVRRLLFQVGHFSNLSPLGRLVAHSAFKNAGGYVWPAS